MAMAICIAGERMVVVKNEENTLQHLGTAKFQSAAACYQGRRGRAG
jgi:hypothetical protein